ncbi:type IV pilus modification protein PilV [Pseudoxanthomonas daejeonensis]|uniref:type IV pilus modification protein PilV n=1 Tax=Pseudoxanthomonas daejeonensis TaxID=266062 RepID=UPI001F54322F|nr:type IV pilus modification protein PilV [Pseudoxanthomonas daejeonensis]UNK56708.1 type IV pilus modification protein PilV [Pseudoxanthomonas daejeonensis]
MAGFSLVEVMVAVLILGVGLLGFALLQTMSVRFTQSANQRSQATNLAYDMLDQVRVNRLAVGQYVGNYTGATTGCAPDGEVSAAKFRDVWECRLGTALGAGATANVAFNAGEVTVAITWGDERWNDADGDGTVSADEGNQTFTTVTRL